jgi:hypothetical protein
MEFEEIWLEGLKWINLAQVIYIYIYEIRVLVDLMWHIWLHKGWKVVELQRERWLPNH